MTQIAILLAFGVAASSSAIESKRFGKPLQGWPRTSLESVLAHPQNGRRVRLEGRIERVCQKKGCWLELREGERSVLVSFEGYSFFVPKGSAGRDVVLEGRLKLKPGSPEEIKHLQDEGGGEAAAARVEVVARGVEIRTPAP
ncbi:MAG TPA: DUF4920 domain-containing protein [Vicinamibacteria bacterium]|jgi:hypothetical protein